MQHLDTDAFLLYTWNSMSSVKFMLNLLQLLGKEAGCFISLYKQNVEGFKKKSLWFGAVEVGFEKMWLRINMEGQLNTCQISQE